MSQTPSRPPALPQGPGCCPLGQPLQHPSQAHSLCNTHSSPGVRSKTQLPQQQWRPSKQPQTDDEKLNWGNRMLPGNDTKMTTRGNKAPSYPDQELRGRGAPLSSPSTFWKSSTFSFKVARSHDGDHDEEPLEEKCESRTVRPQRRHQRLAYI